MIIFLILYTIGFDKNAIMNTWNTKLMHQNGNATTI
jgi:hypothetical protein